MELRDTVDMMLSDDYKERFKAEYFQLQTRYIGLRRMIDKYIVGKLPFTPKCDVDTLREQRQHMYRYMKVLERRAEIEGIDLTEAKNNGDR